MKNRYFTIFMCLGFLFAIVHVNGQQRKCAANEVLEKQIARDPSFAGRMLGIEKQTQEFIALKRSQGLKKPDNPGKPGGGGGGTPPPDYSPVTIPVVVHVVYNTATENVSDNQIQSQIDVLNKDFNATNSDFNNYVPSDYQASKGNSEISFCLVQTIRKNTSVSSFGVNDAVKYASSGGSDAIEPTKYLNVWVCDLSGGYLGYAQFPGGAPATDGVVIDYQAFGTNGSASAPFNLGRTGTHEVGHWLNLRHIWGDRRCGNDFVDDTPDHDGPNYGCPPQGIKSSCKKRPAMMWMNYMDYTDDGCMYIFSEEQTYRMQATLIEGGVRHGYTNGCNNTASRKPLSDLDNLKVYPVASGSQFNMIVNASKAGSGELKIYSLSGVLLMKESIRLNEGKNLRQFSTPALASGVYLLQFVKGNEIFSQKLIVQS